MNEIIRFVIYKVEDIIFGKLLKRTRVALSSELDKNVHDDFIKELCLNLRHPEDTRSKFEEISDILSVERKYNVKHIWRS